MRKNTLFLASELLLTAILFVSAAAIITGTILSTVTTTRTTTTTPTTVLAASEEGEEEKSKKTTATKEKTTNTANANEKSLTTTPSGLPLPTTSTQQQSSPTTTSSSDSTVITPPLDSKTTTSTTNNKEITTQSLSSVKTLQTNNIVNTASYYDIFFKTGTTADIAKVDIAFPNNVGIGGRVTVEASGIGRGSTTFSGNTITYNVDGSQIKSISSGTTIRLEFGNIINPSSAGNSFTVTVTTKKSDGTVIEGPATSSAFIIKQIGTTDIAPNAVTSSRIADHAVTGSKIAGTSKLVFVKCTVSSSTSVDAGFALHRSCNNSSVSDGDAAIAIHNGNDCFDIRTVDPQNGRVDFLFVNECPFSQTLGTTSVSALVFKPTP